MLSSSHGGMSLHHRPSEPFLGDTSVPSYIGAYIAVGKCATSGHYNNLITFREFGTTLAQWQINKVK